MKNYDTKPQQKEEPHCTCEARVMKLVNIKIKWNKKGQNTKFWNVKIFIFIFLGWENVKIM